MMKKLLSLILCLVMLCPGAVFANETPITVIVNGAVLQTPVSPELVNDRTMLPMRAIFEAMGAKVNWAADDQMIFATRGESLLVLKIGVAKYRPIKTNKYHKW